MGLQSSRNAHIPCQEAESLGGLGRRCLIKPPQQYVYNIYNMVAWGTANISPSEGKIETTIKSLLALACSKEWIYSIPSVSESW